MLTIVNQNLSYVTDNNFMAVNVGDPTSGNMQNELIRLPKDFALSDEMQTSFDTKDWNNVITLMRRDKGWTIPVCVCVFHWYTRKPTNAIVN